MSEVSQGTADTAIERGHKKTRRGYVVSDKMEKTVVVRVDRRMSHSKFKKVITTSKKYYAHDEDKTAGVGDLVLIQETRPMSRLKRWRVVEVLDKARD